MRTKKPKAKTVVGLSAALVLIAGLFVGTATATLSASANAAVGVSGLSGGTGFFHAAADSSAAADPTDIGFTIQATYQILLNGIPIPAGPSS